ncbi:hypothetical protein DL96DRAFT_1705091 [Flagelloscypha sp. PMI_526]|nr:hypothetical protein DL96DRAFT_1705091 [Flagelloscypha sp. PMI_526]
MQSSTTTTAAQSSDTTFAFGAYKPKAVPSAKDKRPNVCSICSATFSRKSHLSRHMRSHTNERPHRCDMCSAEFTRSDLLRRHQRFCDDSPTKSKRKSCEACAESKIKCSLTFPCTKCCARGKECVFLNDPEKTRAKQARRRMQGSAYRSATNSSCPSPSSSSSSYPPSPSSSASGDSMLFTPDHCADVTPRPSIVASEAPAIGFDMSAYPASAYSSSSYLEAPEPTSTLADGIGHWQQQPVFFWANPDAHEAWLDQTGYQAPPPTAQTYSPVGPTEIVYPSGPSDGLVYPPAMYSPRCQPPAAQYPTPQYTHVWA